MEIIHRQVAAVAILDVRGRIVAGEDAQMLRDGIRTLLNRGQRDIILNLQRVPYIDSAAIGVLVSSLVAVCRESGSLKLTGLTHRVREVMEIVKLHTVFPIFETEAEALATYTVPENFALVLQAGAR